MSKPKPSCIYFFQFDEVRPDHLLAYGYHRKQKYLERIARDGILFETCIAGSSYTGAATPIIHTGMIGPHTGVRDPYGYITAPLIQQYLKKDPIEQVNLIERLEHHAPRFLQSLREELNEKLVAEPKGIKREEMPEEEKKAIEERLRRLGYIE